MLFNLYVSKQTKNLHLEKNKKPKTSRCQLCGHQIDVQCPQNLSVDRKVHLILNFI